MTEVYLMTEIQRLVELQHLNISLPMLPLMHSTNCSIAEDVINSDQLSTADCPNFKESLLYLFYGKLTYKVSASNTKPRTDYLFSPCCFILNPDKVKVKQIYPFDTGAFFSGIYDDLIPPDINIHSYELAPKINQTPAFIKLFYGSNENYLAGICTVEEEKLTNKVITSLGTLLKSCGLTKFDDRARTIEITSAKSVTISDAAKAIIVPKPFLRNEYFKDFTRKNPSIEIIPYHIHYPTDPSSHNEILYQETMNYLQREGLL